jgi:hypothetical protein
MHGEITTSYSHLSIGICVYQGRNNRPSLLPHVRHQELSLPHLRPFPATIQLIRPRRTVPPEEILRRTPLHEFHQCTITQPCGVPIVRNHLFMRILYEYVYYTKMLTDVFAYAL